MSQDNSQASLMVPTTVTTAATLDTRDVPYFDGLTVQVGGAFSGTILAEVSNDNGTTWSAISIRDEASTSPGTRIAAATGIAGPGVYYIRLPWASFRLRCSVFTSGVSPVNLYYSINDISA